MGQLNVQVNKETITSYRKKRALSLVNPTTAESFTLVFVPTVINGQTSRVSVFLSSSTEPYFEDIETHCTSPAAIKNLIEFFGTVLTYPISSFTMPTSLEEQETFTYTIDFTALKTKGNIICSNFGKLLPSIPNVFPEKFGKVV
jgi:hypothetical protein